MNLPDLPGAPVEVLLFALMSVLAIAGALSVICARDPFVSALSLLGNFVSLGVLYLLVDQPFVAVSQILVYAGAVVVLFLFVIAYLGDRRSLPELARRAKPLRPIALGVGATVAVGLAVLALVMDYPAAHDVADDFGGAAFVGEAFMTDFLLQFEATSIVLLVAAIGGIVLGLTGRARHRRLRKLMNTRSADQQRRIYNERARGEQHHEQAPRTEEPIA